MHTPVGMSQFQLLPDLSLPPISVSLKRHCTLTVHMNSDIQLGFTTVTSLYATSDNVPHSHDREILIEGTKLSFNLPYGVHKFDT
jgi:hypothetical protein